MQQLLEVLGSDPAGRAANSERRHVALPPNPDGNAVFRSLVIQVAVIGSANSRNRLLALSDFKSWTVRSLLSLSPRAREIYIHQILAKAGVRYVSKKFGPNHKVRAILRMLEHESIVQNHECVWLNTIQRNRTGWSRFNECRLRRSLYELRIPFFGLKSISDWCNNYPLTNYLIAFDRRILNFCRDVLLWRVTDSSISTPDRYEHWENQLDKAICQKIGIGLSELDKRIFTMYSQRIISEPKKNRH